MAPNAELPKCISIILCDDVFRDERSKKLVIVGTFSNINGSLPVLHSRMCVLFTLTNGRGDFDFCLSIEHAETERALVQVQGPMTLRSPLDIIDYNVELLGTRFDVAGKYAVNLKANGELIATRPFFVGPPNAEATS